MKVLVIGSGGREHCLAFMLAKSALVNKVYCAPGNGGTSGIAKNVDISASDITGLLQFAKEKEIDLTVVGPEAPLVEGIVDVFQEAGLRVFGPSKELSQLEGSKIFTKEILNEFNIPTARYEAFDDFEKALEFVKEKGAPLVIKADGLAAGKGVVVAQDIEEAKGALRMIMVDKKFGQAGERVIIEECLSGEEASILIFTDGDSIIPLVSSQDHKPVFDGDNGPNTGGMGAYSPAPLVDDALLKKIMDKVFNPLITGLSAQGRTYRGVLYAGLMIKDGEPYGLEFNVRFGDPETQAILPKLKSDLADIMLKTVEGKLGEVSIEWDDRFCLCVVLASGGYPGSYQKDKEIRGLASLDGLEDTFIFHAGTKQQDKLTTSGGRVLGVVGLGATIEESQRKAYEAVARIDFEGMHYRRDIGSKALKFSPKHVE